MGVSVDASGRPVFLFGTGRCGSTFWQTLPCRADGLWVWGEHAGILRDLLRSRRDLATSAHFPAAAGRQVAVGIQGDSLRRPDDRRIVRGAPAPSRTLFRGDRGVHAAASPRHDREQPGDLQAAGHGRRGCDARPRGTSLRVREERQSVATGRHRPAGGPRCARRAVAVVEATTGQHDATGRLCRHQR